MRDLQEKRLKESVGIPKEQWKALKAFNIAKDPKYV